MEVVRRRETGEEPRGPVEIAFGEVWGRKGGSRVKTRIHDSPHFEHVFRLNLHIILPTFQQNCHNAPHIHEPQLVGNSTSDWSNWREQEFLWDTLYGNLSKEQTEEFLHFVKQNRLQVEREKRRHDFDERLRLQIEAFEEAERDQWLDTVYSFGYSMWVGRVQVSTETVCMAREKADISGTV